MTKNQVFSAIAIVAVLGAVFFLTPEPPVTVYKKSVPSERLKPLHKILEEPIDKVLKRLALGNIAFNAPSRMDYGETKSIQLLLAAKTFPADLEKMVREEGLVESHRIRISDRMEVRLVGEAFAITPITPDIQPVSIREVTEWKWDIRPKRHGLQRLHLSVNAIVAFSGRDETRSIRTFDKTISVEILSSQGAFSYARDNWEIIAGICGGVAIVIGAMWAFFVWWRRKDVRPDA